MVFVSRAQENANGSDSLFEDFDQDGLSNDEELAYGTDPYNKDTDGDGYSDYTEINSGYDPLKPAPGDRIVESDGVKDTVQGQEDDSTNNDSANAEFTTQVSEDLAALLSSAMNKEEGVSVEDMYSVVGEILNKGTDSLQLEDIDKDRIKIKKQSYDDLSDEERDDQIRQDAEEYVSAVSYIMAVNFPDLTTTLADASSDNSQKTADNLVSKLSSAYLSGDYTFINELAEKGDAAVEQMYDVEVPESLVDIHVQGLKIGQYAKGLKGLIEGSGGDPLENMAYLSMVQGLLVSIQDFHSSLFERLTDLGVDNIQLEFLGLGADDENE